MQPKSDAEIRVEYADLAPEGSDPSLTRLLRALDAAYDAPAPTAPISLARGGRPASPASKRVRTSIITRFLVLAAVAVVALTIHGFASTDISDLGKPANDTPAQYDRLENYGRVLPGKRPSGRVAVTLYDTPWDVNSAAGRWGIIKALHQFGRWSDLRKTTSAQAVAEGSMTDPSWKVPTYDLSHVHYSSSYVTFRHVVMQARRYGPHTHLSPREMALLNRVYRLPTVQSDRYIPLPAVVAGRYGWHGPWLEAWPLAVLQVPMHLLSPRSFDDVQRDWQKGDRGPYWVSEGNQYVNIVTAIICHEDGGRPHSVCLRHAIRYTQSKIK